MFRNLAKKRFKDLQLEARWCVFAEMKIYQVRISWTVLFHILVYILMLIRYVLLDILPRYPPAAITKYRQVTFIPMELWEMIWLCSLLSSSLVTVSSKYSRFKYLTSVVIGNLVFGIGPLLYGIWENRTDFLTFVSERDIPALSLLFPYTQEHREAQEKISTDPHSNFVLLQLYWICLSLQVHIYQIWFTMQLYRTWKSTKAT